jgi:hypothetical protein
VSTVEETLAREAEQRPRALAAALVAGIAGFAGAIMVPVVTSDGPTQADGFVSLPDALSARLDGRAPTEPSLLVRQVDYFGDQWPVLGLAAVLTAIGAAGAALLLLFLFRATMARNEQVSRLGLYATLAGLIMVPIGHLIWRGSVLVGAAGFEDEPVRTHETAADIVGSGGALVGQLIQYFGSFALGLAFVLVSLNAMRVGLLTRFFGVLGIIVGVLAVIQLDAPQLVRTIWLIGVGLLVAGRLPGGLTPAWRSGRAVPWPSQQELREQRAAAAAGRRGEDATERAAARPASSGARRKRKKRR